MEEKKKGQAKVTYKELENFCQQLTSQLNAVLKENQELKNRLQQANNVTMFAALDAQFKVLSNAKMFSEQFVESVVKNIERTMSFSEEKPEDISKEESNEQQD